MPRTALTVQTIPPHGGGIQSITFTAADATNNHEFENDGRTMLLAKCTDASSKTVTVVSVPDLYGRSGNLAMVVPATTGEAIAGPFPPGLWSQSNGRVNVDVSAATGLSLAAVRYTP